MGVVYRAEDEQLRRTVALKILLDASRNEDKRQRFLREARSAASITHPNVAVVHQIDEVDGRIYIAMELVEGENPAGQQSEARADSTCRDGSRDRAADRLVASRLRARQGDRAPGSQARKATSCSRPRAT